MRRRSPSRIVAIEARVSPWSRTGGDDDPFLEISSQSGDSEPAHAADIVEMRPGLSKGDELTIAEHRGGELTVSC
jgi:hypothetical protein